jgi:UDP-glucose:glycoprotein glucosyltransferase
VVAHAAAARGQVSDRARQACWVFSVFLPRSEFFADEDSALFWSFVELVNAGSVSILSSDREQYEFALAAGAKLLGKAQQSVLQISLASRFFSPAVELHRTLAQSGNATGVDHASAEVAFVRLGEDVTVTKVEQLDAALRTLGRSSGRVVLPGDHVLHGDAPVTAVLYGNLGTRAFGEFHRALVNRSGVAYVLRHRPPVADRRVRLSGFGVEAHLKSTEYKVVDDSHQAAKPSGDSGAKGDNLEPVPKTEVSGLGARIAQTIAASPNPLEALQRLSQNFPIECHEYRKAKINSTFVAAVQANQQRMQAGHTAVLINGRHVNVANVNFFELLKVLAQEIRTSVALNSIEGVTPETARALTIRSTQQTQVVAPYFDVRSPHVRYLNNVESDPAASSWPTSLRNFLRQQWPGMPFGVRRNAITAIAIVDLSLHDTVCALAQVGMRMGLVQSNDMQMHTLGAVRVGIIPVGKSVRSALVSKAFHALKEPSAALSFLQELCVKGTLRDEDAFESTFEAAAETTIAKLNATTEGSPAAANKWCEKDFGVPLESIAAGAGFQLFVNGKSVEPEGSLSDALSQGIAEQTQQLQMLVYRGQLADNIHDIHEWFLLFFRAAKSFSRFGLSPEAGGPVTRFVPLVTPSAAANADLAANLKRLSFSGTCEPFCGITHIVVADLATASGRKLLESAMYRALEGDSRVRIAVIPLHRPRLAKQVLAKWKAGRIIDIEDILSAAGDTDSEDEKEAVDEELAQLAAFAHRVLKLSNGVVTNGRLMAIGPEQSFSRIDFEAVEGAETRKRADHVASVMKSLNPTLAGEALSTAIMQACSALASEDVLSFPRYDLRTFATPTLTIPSKSGRPTLVIDALLDPLSEAGKKFGSILLNLIPMFDCEVNLVLNPLLSLDDLPLKQFYRYVAATSLSFRPDGRIDESAGTTASFPNLPSQTLFSLSLDVPDSWLVDAVAAPHDLDNLRLADISDDIVGALYELTHLAVEGGCKDTSPRKSEVRGMQVQLESSQGVRYESLVTETGGYFQIRASPGLWHLSLLGRSGQLFQIVDNKPVVVREFSSPAHALQVARPRGASTDALLGSDPEADAKLQAYNELRGSRGAEEAARTAAHGKKAGMLKGWFGAGEKKADDAAAAVVPEPSNETIHVFSIASGHLYERFLSIMMYTTVRSTKSPVKFWFLKQFLSPQFKRFLPVMAAKYGFEFELVTYKWPRWLRRQTEKQRHIWAYKILFLDVLFPSSVERVIFVDADQIVREDLAKLRTLDLQGAPYAFTPFCSHPENRRLETKGFRFWESGYWKETLNGLPYHISALFVVDLKRFRQLAAGDILRSSYHQLSADPNSLANLDQDLPNVLQGRLTIFSLPERWLWCETWCTDASFTSALSIDLCNNPQNKVPKLDNAKRIFPDWTSWDAELGAIRKVVDAESHEKDLQIIQAMNR